jgi:hypothetical protein
MKNEQPDRRKDTARRVIKTLAQTGGISYSGNSCQSNTYNRDKKILLPDRRVRDYVQECMQVCLVLLVIQLVEKCSFFGISLVFIFLFYQ